MNLKQINLFREMVRYFELAQNNLNDVSLSKVRYAKETLDDLEDEIPNQQQIDLLNDILDYKHLITKNELILENLNFFKCDGCSERNMISDLEHNIKKAQIEIKQILIERIRVREHPERKKESLN